MLHKPPVARSHFCQSVGQCVTPIRPRRRGGHGARTVKTFGQLSRSQRAMAPSDQGPHGGALGSGGAALIVVATGYIATSAASSPMPASPAAARPASWSAPRAPPPSTRSATRAPSSSRYTGRRRSGPSGRRGGGAPRARRGGGDLGDGRRHILDQLRLIDAVRAAGTVKRFLPSECGHDVDRARPVGAGLGFYEEKRRVRRAAEASGVPYTYICCNSIAGWPYFDNMHPSEVPPPLDRFQIYGDGNVRAFFVAGSDIGKFTVMAAYDPRSANKIVHFRPTCNLLSTNEMASLWESKIGRTLPRVTLSEDDLLAVAAEHHTGKHSSFADARHIYQRLPDEFPLDGCRDIEISSLYPDIPLRTVDECFDDYARGLHLEGEAAENTNSNAPAVERLAVPPTCA
ncbi:hypothetical protein ACP70R_016419 [Stipagrostis hirtigluma subsp. patula]